MPSPVDLALRQQIYLDRLKAGFERDWNAVHISLRERVRVVLAALDAEDLQEITARKLSRVLEGLRAAMVEVTAPAMGDFLRELEGLAEYAALKEAADLEALVANPPPKFGKPTAKIAFEAALANPVQATGELLEPFIKEWPYRDAMRVSNLIRKGWAQNLTLQDMIRQTVGTRKNGYKDGFLDVSRRHAGTVINTAAQHVANSARQATWEANNDLVRGYRWVSTLDRRTTQQCKSLDGREFEPGKGPLPPIHPNCRSTTTAIFNDAFSVLDEDGERASGGPKPGYVDGDTTFYKWLKTQPVDFQDLAIGPTRGKLFRNGGLSADDFARLNIGKNFEPLTLAEMRVINPEAFRQAGL